MSAAISPTIRRARKADIDSLVVIEDRAFAGDRLSRRQFRHLLTRGNASVLIAELDGVQAGDVVVLYNRATSNARLYSIAVDSDFRGRGVARALVAAAEADAIANSRAWMRLEIRKDNAPSIALFESLGYHRFGEYAHYYDDEEDAWRYEKTLHATVGGVGLGNDVPFYEQSLEFTCGAASLIMAMAALDPEVEISRRHELRLWREATTVFMTSGHGGCGPYGLAVAAMRRGFPVEVFINDTSVHFADSVRDLAKKAVIELVQHDMEEELRVGGVPIHETAMDLDRMRELLAGGAVVLALISSWQIYESKSPHWVVVTGMNDRFVFINDPLVDREEGEVRADSIQIPVRFEIFWHMSRYGRRALRAAVVLHPRASTPPR